MTNGIYVAVHNQSRLPLVSDEGMFIPTGTSAYVGVKRTFYYRLSSPFSNCRKDIDTTLDSDSDYFVKTRKITQYSRRLCYQVCFQYKYVYDQCDCTDPSIPVVDESDPICYSLNNLTCVDEQLTRFDKSSINLVCDDDCPEECDSIEYETRLSLANYPSSYYASVLGQQDGLSQKFNLNSGTKPSTSQLSESLVQLTVYYETLKYVEITESQAVTFDTLVGVVGKQ